MNTVVENPGIWPWLLTVTWLIPAFVAAVLTMVPNTRPGLIRSICAWTSGINLILIIVLVIQYIRVSAGDNMADATLSKFHFVQVVPWFELMNIEYAIGVDGISMIMMLLTAVVIFCGVFASWTLTEQPKEFFILLNVLVSGVYGVFISFDLFTLFLFYEVAVLPMYLLIGVWGTGKKEYSAMKLTLMLVAGSALIFAGILGMYFASGIRSFNILDLASVQFSPEFQAWAFPATFLGFGVLGALFPFHTWSPDGHASAPTAVSMLHAGVLMKLGGYGCLRVAMYLLPEGCQQWMPLFLILITINVVYGAYGAIRQTDLKYITAYSSVSHCGFVLFGFAALTFIGLKGAVLQMVSHGLMTALFFCLIGMIYGRTHTREIGKMGGLMKVIPFLSVAFVIAGLASLGLPGLSGFVAEATIFIGAFANDSMLNRVCTVLAVSSIVVTAVYVLRAANRMLSGPLNQEFAGLKDAGFIEKIPVVILLACLFGMGILPGWIFDLIDPSIAPIFNNIMR